MADPNFPPISIPGTGTLHARLHTNQGEIIVRLEEERAPKTVANFVGLAIGTMAWTDAMTGAPGAGPLYENIRFHRVIPGFMVQCGDPLTRHTDTANRWGTGGPGYRFGDEIHPELRHDRPGVLSMANAGPGTNGSQFFITEGPTPHLDGRHAVFGYVVSGMEIVNKIANTKRGPSDRPQEDQILERVDIFRQ
jgi:peptidyl-prolyl cis-trans isomerase A (cyclophilin A)